MIIHLDRTGTIAGLKEAIASTLSQESVKGLLILSCDGNHLVPQQVNQLLGQIYVPVVGGIFPEIIHSNQHYSTGTIVAGLAQTPEVHLIPGLSDPQADYLELIESSIGDVSQPKTMLVFVDGLSSRITDLINSLFSIFGLEINCLGGGAGSLSFEQKPCLFTNQGLIEDHALLALLPFQSGIGVQHGWKSISGPFQITESTGNIIHSIDWKPAFSVYKQVVEAASQQILTKENFFEIAKGFPFGFTKMGTEMILRDPIKVTEEGAMVCIGAVEENGFLDILEGNKESVVKAAKLAQQQGLAAFPNPENPYTILFMDCISRVLFLQEHYTQELNAVHDGKTPLIGALTLGEIANTGRDYPEFYNKTAVVGVLEA